MSKLKALIEEKRKDQQTTPENLPTEVRLSEDDLISMGTTTVEIMELIRVLARCGANVIIVGTVNTGKTTMLNIMRSYIDGDITEIESLDDMDSLFEKKTDRVIIDEVDGMIPQALDAMTQGAKIMATLRAASIEAALIRMEQAMVRAYPQMPLEAIKRLIYSSVDVLIHMDHSLLGGITVGDIRPLILSRNGKAWISTMVQRFTGVTLNIPYDKSEIRTEGFVSEALGEKINNYGFEKHKFRPTRE